jgi:hypothetical protein
MSWFDLAGVTARGIVIGSPERRDLVGQNRGVQLLVGHFREKGCEAAGGGPVALAA